MNVTSVIVRVSLMYIYVLALVRLAGKRSAANLSPFDFVMAILIADLIDHVLSAKVSLPQGLTAITTLVGVHILVSYATAHSPWLRYMFEDSKTPVILQGRFMRGGLRKERTSPENVLSELRLKKIDEAEIADIKEASWERNGGLSVLKQEEAKPVQKKDLLSE